MQNTKKSAYDGRAGRGRLAAGAVCTCLFAAWFAADGVWGGQVLATRSSLTVGGSDILLEDIVVDPSTLPEEWKNRVVLPAPQPGGPKNYTLYALACGLEQYADMADVSLNGPVKLTVEREGAVLDPGCIAKAIELFARDHERWKGKEIAVRCEPLRQSVVASTNAALPTVLSCEPAKGVNRYRFELSIDAGGKEARVLPVYANVVPVTKVWATVRDLPRGHLLSPGDLEAQPLPQNATGRYVTDDTCLEGLELNRPALAGQPLETHYLVAPLCARQGETVDVTAQRGMLRILMRAKALSAGRRDERIFCLNETSGRRLSVRLTGTRTATAE